MAFDLLIKGGLVVDGTGDAPQVADVGIVGGRVAAVGQLDGPASREIDASGCVVTPGFIDHHTHYDGQVTFDPLCTFSCYNGVTTVVRATAPDSQRPCARATSPCRMLANGPAIPTTFLMNGAVGLAHVRRLPAAPLR